MKRQSNASLFKGTTAVGVSVDGHDMHLVRLGMRDKEYFVLDARTFRLQTDHNSQGLPPEPGRPPHEEDEILAEARQLAMAEEGGGGGRGGRGSDPFAGGDVELDPVGGGIGDLDLPSQEEEANASDAGAFMEVARLARGSRFVLSLPEPQLQYTVIEAGSGETGKKRERLVLTDLAMTRQEDKPPRKDAVELLPLTEDRTLAITRDVTPRSLDELAGVRSYLGFAPPALHSLEATDISLINLLLLESAPLLDQVTVIMNIGRESSRFIFLKGRDIHHISPIIPEGSSSRNIAGIAASRLGFELDHLNLDRVDRILLAGDACKVGVDEMLEATLPGDIEIGSLTGAATHLRLPRGRELDDLAPHAAALGAALTALQSRKEDTLDVDLLPKRLRDAQNKWLIAWPGWIMLLLIPAILVLGSWQYIDTKREIFDLRSQIYPMRVQMEEVKKVEAAIAAGEQELSDFDRSFSVIDSLAMDTHTWSRFLLRLQNLRNAHRYFWLTEAAANDDGTVHLVGNSLYRETVTGLVNDLGADLARVEVQDIRGRTVYHFEANAPLNGHGGDR